MYLNRYCKKLQKYRPLSLHLLQIQQIRASNELDTANLWPEIIDSLVKENLHELVKHLNIPSLIQLKFCFHSKICVLIHEFTTFGNLIGFLSVCG